MKLPKVSVIITSYNYAGYIVGVAESALGQDYEGELEVIVVDDGSTDDTLERLAPLGERIKLISRANGGQSAALNTGFAASSGEIICPMDSDDWWTHDKVSSVVECFIANPGAGMVHHRLKLVGADGSNVDYLGNPVEGERFEPRMKVKAHGDVGRYLLEHDFPWIFSTTSGMAFTREALALAYPLDEGYKCNADAFAAYPVAMLSPVVYLDRVLGHFRVHGQNAGAYVGADQERWAADQLRYFEAVYKQIEDKLARAGRAIRLHPEGSWRHVKLHAMAERKMPVLFAPRALAELFKRSELGPADKLGRALRIISKSVERSLTRKYTGSAER